MVRLMRPRESGENEHQARHRADSASTSWSARASSKRSLSSSLSDGTLGFMIFTPLICSPTIAAFVIGLVSGNALSQ